MSQDMSREQLSALMDAEGDYRGQSARTEATAAFIRHVASDERRARDWLIYAQIGDVLRSADLTPMPGRLTFCSASARRLRANPSCCSRKPWRKRLRRLIDLRHRHIALPRIAARTGARAWPLAWRLWPGWR
jgi:Anti sigma-E protein RseA, N-terminal domain.